MKKIYKVINIYFSIHDIYLKSEWEKYEKSDNNLDFVIGGIYPRDEIYYMRIYDIPSILQYRIIEIDKDIMIVEKDWRKSYIILPVLEKVVGSFSIQLFYTHAVQRHIIYLHSSLIDWKGRGLMFLGPSGIGKTTQAELWNQYRDALIINGDVVFVQETENAFLGWGTPWHGSSPYCENASVPVEALIVLKQAPENSIRELTGFEKVTAVSESVFYPRWLEGGMELCLETLDHLLTALPVYELSCRPDEAAVELVEKTIFGKT